MAQVKFEEPAKNENEVKLQESIKALVEGVNHGKGDYDCRVLRLPIFTLFAACGCNMIIGCGGSHIYIHRAPEFTMGAHNHPGNVRWAIITD